MFIDFSQVQDGFDLIPEGPVDGRLASVSQKVGQSSGKPYLEWIFDVTDDDYPGRKLYFNTSLQPQSLWSLKRMLINAFHVDEDALADNFDLDPEDLVGIDVTLMVTHRAWNGQKRENVENVISSGTTELLLD